MDESKPGKRKYNRGSHEDGCRVVGGTDCKSWETFFFFFFFFVKASSTEMLLHISIEKFILKQ